MVAQFTDVAGPGIVADLPDGRRRKRRRCLHLAVAVLLAEELDQQRDVFLAFAERLDPDREDAEPEVQVLAECLLRDLLLQILVGGGDDPRPHRDRGVGPEGGDNFFLEDPQQLGLQRDRQAADLVEKQGPLAGIFELADLALHRPGEGSLEMAEKFRFHHLGGHGPHVDGDEGMVGAAADLVDGAGHQFLAGTGLAADQDRITLGGDRLDDVVEPVHRRVVADQTVEAGQVLPLLGEAEAEPAVLEDEPAFLHRPDQAGEEDILVDRFLEEIVGPALDGGHREGNVAVAGDHDHRQFPVRRLDVVEELQPVHDRHLDVGDDGGVFLFVELVEGLDRRGEGVDRISVQTQGLVDGHQQVAVVVDHHDPLFMETVFLMVGHKKSFGAIYVAMPSPWWAGRKTVKLVPSFGVLSTLI